MTTLFDATLPVKPSRSFGRGILASRPNFRPPVTFDDQTWWAEESARLEHRARQNATLERRAGASSAVDRMSRGIGCI
jgi:hypothetical protein